MSTQPGDLIETVTLEVRAAGDGAKPITVGVPASTAVHDIWAFRAAVVAVGVALSVFLVGAAVIFAVTKEVPNQYWTAGSAISGALIGILVPSKADQPTQKVAGDATEQKGGNGKSKSQIAEWSSENLRMVILFVIFLVSVVLGATLSSTQEFHSLAAASAGALIGVLVPAPSREAK
jgi:hypothetical protein